MITAFTSILTGIAALALWILNNRLRREMADRAQMEQALRESEAKYRDLVERANDGIVVVQDGCVKYSNPQLAAMLGYTAAETAQLLSQPFENFLPDAEKAKVRARYEKRIGGQAPPSRYESAVLHKDGHQVAIEVNAGVMDYEGRPATLSFIRDITDRKHADHIIHETLEEFSALNTELVNAQRELVHRNAELQRANTALQAEIAKREQIETSLRESEARYRSLFEDSPVALWEEDFSAVKQHLDALRAAGVTDFAAYFAAHPEAVMECFQMTKILDVNRATVALYGAANKEQLLQNLHLTFNDSSFAALRAALVSLARGNSIFECETTNYTLRGELIYLALRVFVFPDYIDTFARVLVAMLDVTAQKKVAEALRRSEETLVKAQEIAHFGSWEWDLVTDAVTWSAETYRIFGIEPHLQERKLALATERVHPDDRANDLQAINAAISGRQPAIFEQRIFRPDGEIRYIYGHCEAFYDADSTPIRVIGTVQDITERKRAEAAIQRANAELERRIAALSALNYIFQTIATMTDMEASLQIVARAITELFDTNGCAITLLNEARTELRVVAEYSIYPNQPSAVGFVFPLDSNYIDAQVIATGRGAVVTPEQLDLLAEDAYELLQARHSQCQVIVPLMARGAAFGTITMGADHAGRKFAPEEQELLETIAGQISGGIENIRLFAQEQRQRQIAESLREVAQVLNSTLDRDAVLERILTELGRVIRYDSAGIFLYDGEDLVLSGGAQVIERFFGTRIPIASADPVAQVFNTQQPKIIADVHADPCWNQWEDEEPIHAWMGAPLLVSRRGIGVLTIDSFQVAEYVESDAAHLQIFANQAAIAIENARLFAETRQAREAAETANRAKSTFLANMSHELRTPMHAILGFAQIMARSPDMPEEHRENLNTILRSGEHLLNLINQVLELSKIEAGRAVVTETDFDLYAMLACLERMFHPRAAAKGLQLTFARAAQVAQYIRTDEVKLRQVLINLLDNAVKFTEQGSITLRVRQTAAPPRPFVDLHFEVADTGPGIAPTDQESLFETFVQAEARQNAQEGAGLGLPISRKFAELLRGRLTVDSAVGRGATFKLDLPVRVVSPADIIIQPAPPRRVPVLAPGQPRYRVLIVADKWSNRQPLVKLFSPLDFEVAEASTGAEAVEIWQQWQPHLIWLDLRMAGMDGYAAPKEIKTLWRDNPAAAPPIIIALTAQALAAERESALAAGCDDFLSEPFSEAAVFELMRKHLGIRYIYADQPPAETAPPPPAPPPLTPAALAALPADLLDDLERATIRSQLDQISTIVTQIRGVDPALAAALESLADNFDYAQILAAIQAAKE